MLSACRLPFETGSTSDFSGDNRDVDSFASLRTKELEGGECDHHVTERLSAKFFLTVFGNTCNFARKNDSHNLFVEC